MKLGNLPALRMSFLALAATLIAGCESIALVGRPSINPAEHQEEIRAEVDRLDTRSKEIFLRTDRGRTQIVNYDSDTRVVYRGREYPVSDLRSGDSVLLQVKQNSRGKSYADLIRVQEASGDRRSDSGRFDNEPRRSDRGVQTLSGTVERVDARSGVFDIRDRSGDRVSVSLPNNAKRSEIDRLQSLRDGDQVRVEGRFVGRDRFELEAFL